MVSWSFPLLVEVSFLGGGGGPEPNALIRSEVEQSQVHRHSNIAQSFGEKDRRRSVKILSKQLSLTNGGEQAMTPCKLLPKYAFSFALLSRKRYTTTVSSYGRPCRPGLSSICRQSFQKPSMIADARCQRQFVGSTISEWRSFCQLQT